MQRANAEAIANRMLGELRPWCKRIEIAGSLRRRRAEVRDLDVVLIPQTQGLFLNGVIALYGKKPEKLGAKYIMLQSLAGIQVDLYLATPATWATLLLIRTGSKEHNILLAQLAKQRGLRLHADGRGLEGPGGFCPAETEQDLFDALGLPYREPWEREC